MKIYLIYILLFFTVISIGCKKKNVPCEQTNETFTNEKTLPSDYLMTYPGSWWEYQNGTIDSCTNWEDVTYKEVNNCSGCEITNLNHHILPRSTRFGVIDFETQINNADKTGTQFFPIIGGENVGETFFFLSTPSAPSAPTYVDYLTYKYYENYLSSYTIQGETYANVKLIREEQFIKLSSSNILPFSTSESYFAKDIGLIEYRLYDNDGNCVDSIELVNHYIAPH